MAFATIVLVIFNNLVTDKRPREIDSSPVKQPTVKVLKKDDNKLPPVEEQDESLSFINCLRPEQREPPFGKCFLYLK